MTSVNSSGVVPLPREILERVNRVLEFHRTSKHTPQSVMALKPITDLSAQPRTYHKFPELAAVTLPTTLLDLPVASLPLIFEGLAALPDSHVQPPQDLKTLATWLFMSYGVCVEKRIGNQVLRLRTCPSASALYPSELYVAAFAIQGLEPGLYSFSPRNFSLTKLREGHEALNQIKRGRPDLAFLKSVPAVIFVSSVFARPAWKYHVRGYRMALLDAGHLVANLVVAANGLGIQTMTRLKLNDNSMRELIGIPPEPSFDEFEAVQSMVVWADDAIAPMSGTDGAISPTRPKPIQRAPLGPPVTPYGSIEAVHHDCVAPGLPIREIHPPLTELSPLAPSHTLRHLAITEELPGGPPIRHSLLTRRSSKDFAHQPFSRDRLLTINRCAFRSGTFVPLHPSGPHLALVRPFWVLHEVTGMTSGIWYYHPPEDGWTQLRFGDFRPHSQYVCLQQPRCGNCAALCVITAPLSELTHGGGPDLYRLAHLEAGIAAQRLALAATACGIGSCAIGSFYDDEARLLLGLQDSGWEILYATALGIPAPPSGPPGHPSLGIG